MKWLLALQEANSSGIKNHTDREMDSRIIKKQNQKMIPLKYKIILGGTINFLFFPFSLPLKSLCPDFFREVHGINLLSLSSLYSCPA